MRILYVTGGIVVADQITKLLVKGFSVPFLGIYHWEAARPFSATSSG